MQIVGLALLAFVVWFGFAERADTTISAFDTHAAVMVLGGSLSAILVSSEEATRAAFTELRHAELSRWQPAIGNWELLSKLAPSFGMVGTITGMIKLFQKMGEDSMDLGSAISLALLATLYGVAFGAGVAGPVGHFLRNLLDERLGALERAEQSVAELIARAGRDGAGG